MGDKLGKAGRIPGFARSRHHYPNWKNTTEILAANQPDRNVQATADSLLSGIGYADSTAMHLGKGVVLEDDQREP